MHFWNSKSRRTKATIQTVLEFNGNTFLEFLKKIHSKFEKCYFFMDKASQHYKSKKVLKYFEDNKDTLIPVYLPTTASRVYGNGRDIEYSQMRSACSEILSIICRF
jgi:hypothetical protein